jgi:putative membrane protein
MMERHTMSENTADTDSALAHHARLSHLSEHLANERTYLAYLRTSVSLMSFGFAINRFSIYLEQFRATPHNRGNGSVLFGSQELGIVMVLFGMALMVWAAVYYSQVFEQIEAREFRPIRRGIFIITLLILVAGAAGIAWLLAT